MLRRTGEFCEKFAPAVARVEGKVGEAPEEVKFRTTSVCPNPNCPAIVDGSSTPRDNKTSISSYVIDLQCLEDREGIKASTP